jgi:hypothetical protein
MHPDLTTSAESAQDIVDRWVAEVRLDFPK